MGSQLAVKLLLDLQLSPVAVQACSKEPPLLPPQKPEHKGTEKPICHPFVYTYVGDSTVSIVAVQALKGPAEHSDLVTVVATRDLVSRISDCMCKQR